MEAAGERVLQYFNANRMVTNPGKTAVLVFRPTMATSLTDRVQISLRGEVINESDEEKALGLWITDDLKWKSQTEKLIKELNYGVSILWKQRTEDDCRRIDQFENSVLPASLWGRRTTNKL